ncbi:LytTR family transcriptional regulator [Clostridium carboxidivorans P7]|uniref:Stage 0 sporulation protein A homolog n=1 Tax=Clostridium carboxidivorans P7 TaxID=536227 RepID=C6Q2V7_9CLOT|nr:LytTR family DNA-binding domain-containing protein [Clostridium carboxidivorans]AKN31520.1 LytTR family transcriptional regulator [Clostridium carboxidivorans P7]EET84173.1 two component transcriptional regulator, LytTR family [Clostridium carboxidivorans P7]EFG87080.1 response regulator receiver domain protein [Clostridium carboxidivorans P7]
MFNILVLEDCEIQRRSLVKILLQTGLNLKIFESDNTADSLKICEDVDINLFFVDIALNESSGLDFALKLRNIEKYKLTWIIFLTTYMNYMIKAFKEVHCYDYILKPYDPEKIIEITNTILKNIHRECELNKEKSVAFNSKGIDIIIATSDIIFLEVNIKNCIIHTRIGKFEINRLALKKALEMIEEPFIIKSHRSFAININYITKIEKYSVTSWNVYFKDYDSCAIIGLKYKQIIKNALAKRVI